MKTILLFILMNLAVTLNAQQALHFRLEIAELTATEKIYNFIVDDYVNILAWQFVMIFDDSKMQFREIRNSIVEGIYTGAFSVESPGYLTTASFDPDIDPMDIPDSTIIYQIVFDITTPGGSTLCFSEASSDYEIVTEENDINMELDQLIVTDECNTGFILDLNPTSADNIIETEKFIEKIFLSKQGELAFTISYDQIWKLILYDITGRVISSLDQSNFSSGRHSIYIGRTLHEGNYILQIRTENIQFAAYQVIAQ